MNLRSFRVRNFRSINDSGHIDVSKITALIGRNESGKTNLLRALESLNPADGIEALNPIKDFPRHRRLEECTDKTDVLSTLWELSDGERSELLKILPRAKDVKTVEIGRWYEATRWVSFTDLASLVVDEPELNATTRKISDAVQAAAMQLEEDAKTKLTQAVEVFSSQIGLSGDQHKWAVNAITVLSKLREAAVSAKVELTQDHEKHMARFEEFVASIAKDKERHQAACKWALETIPILIFLDEYPALRGHQNIAEYLARKQNPNQVRAEDRDFEKLCKVAGLSPEKLAELLAQKEPEARNQLANRAGAVVTNEIRRLWKDRPLKVRFNLDAEHMDTFISDPNAVYDVEVNLDERSRGFKWFFSFYITFAADTKGGDAENAVLLLDEPGLYLHANSQSDLLAHFGKDFTNQILYTTHSPFMVPVHALDAVRTVNISEDAGTTVTNDPTGDARTLFPLQAALGYDLAQSLFVGPNNMVVEGVTDYWILSSVSDNLRDRGRIALHEKLTITPAGGAQKVSYMVALLTSQHLNVLVLLDSESATKRTHEDLVKSRLIRHQNVVFVAEGFDSATPAEADIEDLLDPAVYESLVRESYSKELAGKTLTLNSAIPRIAKRFEVAFRDIGMEFHKTRPARLLLTKMGSVPSAIVTEKATVLFEKLFSAINERLLKLVGRKAAPFT
jgi:predicted ATP-dependent endonuclease of OLD family